jgi:hypothetical protein
MFFFYGSNNHRYVREDVNSDRLCYLPVFICVLLAFQFAKLISFLICKNLSVFCKVNFFKSPTSQSDLEKSISILLVKNIDSFNRFQFYLQAFNSSSKSTQLLFFLMFRPYDLKSVFLLSTRRASDALP